MPRIAFHRPAVLGLTLATSIMCAASAMFAGDAWAADPVQLTLKDHAFTPLEVKVPAHERFRIVITNQDTTPAEFESSDLRAEKIVVPGGSISVMAGPLKPGTYAFFDDYHPDVAKGTVTAIEQQAKE